MSTAAVPGSWGALTDYVLKTSSPFAVKERYEDAFDYLRSECRVLVIGAGGLGCELLKDLAYSGFSSIDVIDLDTIDLSNLNRQFLFQKKHVGQAKAVVAAETINARLLGKNWKNKTCSSEGGGGGPILKPIVTAHVGKIQDKEVAFYKQFNLIIAGLDNIDARRWINNLLHAMVERDAETGEVDLETCIPLLDGGTEGLKGQARVIIPTQTSCFECSLDSFPPQINFPLCTIAETPRLPEHCIEYALVILWDRFFGEKRPSPSVAAEDMLGNMTLLSDDGQADGSPGNGGLTSPEASFQNDANYKERSKEKNHENSRTTETTSTIAEETRLEREIEQLQHQIVSETSGTATRAIPINKDSPVHMQWLYKQALRRALQFGISGVSYQLTMGVVKRIIPAVASTNALISAALVQEALKLTTYCGPMMNNYFMYMGGYGCYAHTFKYEKKDDCLVCGKNRSNRVVEVAMERSKTLSDLLAKLGEIPDLQLKRPSVTSAAGIVFLQNPASLRRAHEYKLGQSLGQLVDFGVFKEGEALVVTDPMCLPSCDVRIRVKLL